MKDIVTIQDIADALGLSRNTVSKAINNSEGVAPTTRERVLKKAIEMGYKLSYAQTLADPIKNLWAFEDQPPGSAGEISLFSAFQYDGSCFAAAMLEHLKPELNKFGYSLCSYYIRTEDILQLRLPDAFPRAETRGIVCVGMFDWAYSDMLCALGLPVLFVDGPSTREGRKLAADQINMDNCAELGRYLGGMLRSGVSRIGFIGNIDHCRSFFERYMALRSALLLAEASFDERFHINENRPVDVYRALSGLESFPELFVCANDYIAIDTIKSLKLLGKSVPEDVMICGFEDAVEARMVKPALTTVRIHTEIMAHSAARLLLSRIRNPSLDFRTVYTQTDLILRDSTVRL